VGSAEVGVEPVDGADDAVAVVLGLDEHVAFVVVDDELGFDAEGFEGVPEFVGLRGGTFGVAIADEDEGGSFGFPDEIDGSAFGVDLWIVVDGFTEERNHPLIDFVFAVVAEPVGDAGSGHSGAEAIGLRDGPHGHVAAIAPAGDAQAVRIDGSGFEGFVDAGHDVAKIAVAEIANVGEREGFAHAETAAGIGLEDEVAGSGEGHGEIAGAGPGGGNGGAWAAVNVNNHRIFLRGLEIAGIDEPALDVEVFIFPVDAF